MEPKGGLGGPGRRWALRASTEASKRPGIAAGVLIRPRGAMSINIVIHDIKYRVCHPVGDKQFLYNSFLDKVSKFLKVFSESCV
jgi:hypothetical protein